MTTVALQVVADFDRDGVYETDLSPYLTEGFRVERGLGRDGAFKISEANVSLMNADGRFSPENPASPLVGMMESGVDVKLTGTPSGGSAVTWWRGFVHNWDGVMSEVNRLSRAQLRLRDCLAYLSDNDDLYVLTTENERTDERLAAIFDEAGFDAGLYELDAGEQTLALHYVRKGNALASARQVVKSEMGGALYANREGKARFLSRANRFGQAYKREVLKDAPIAYYRLGESSGTTARDDGSGTAAPGTYTGGYTLGVAQGIPDADYACTLNGVSGFVDLGTPAKLGLTALWSIEAWFYTSGANTGRGLLSRLTDGSGNCNFFIDFAGVRLPRAGFIRTSTIHAAVAPASLSANQWHHVVATWDGTLVHLYCDGVEVDTDLPGATPNAGTGAFAIGKAPGGGLFVGTEDEIAIYDTVLSPERVAAHYAAGKRLWGDGTNVKPFRGRYAQQKRELVTSVTVVPTIYSVSQDEEEIIRFSRNKDNRPADSLVIPAGGTYKARIPYDTAVTGVSAPIVGEDYLANTQQDGAGTDKTAQLDVFLTDLGGAGDLTLKNTDLGVPIAVTEFRVMGTSAAYIFDRPEFVAEKSIPGQVARIPITVDLPFTDDSGLTAMDYAVAIMRANRYPLPQVTLTFKLERNDDTANALLALDLGDVIRFVDTAIGASGLYLDEWLCIEGISITAERNRLTQVEILGYPTYGYRDLDHIVYDNFSRGSVSTLGTALKGGAWADTAQVGTTASDKARPTNSAEQTPNLALGAADCVVETSLENITASPATTLAGIVYRHADANNYWRAYVDKNAAALKLDKVVAGSVTNKASVAWTVTDTVELQVIAQGHRHRVRLTTPAGARTFLIDVDDADLKDNTEVGLYFKNTTVTDADEFYGQGC